MLLNCIVPLSPAILANSAWIFAVAASSSRFLNYDILEGDAVTCGTVFFGESGALSGALTCGTVFFGESGALSGAFTGEEVFRSL